MTAQTLLIPAIYTRVHDLGDAFVSLKQTLESTPRFCVQVHPGVIKDEFDRFKIWTGNIAAHRQGRRSLEYRLRDAAHLKEETHKLLTTLHSSLQQALAIIEGQRKPWDEMSDSESDDEVSSVGDDEDDTELKQVAASIKITITCLFRLSISIRDPAPESQLRSTITVDKSHFEQHDIMHAKAKFPRSTTQLAERLGRAISGRRQYLSYREAHHQKLAKNVELIGIEKLGTEYTSNSTEATPHPGKAFVNSFDVLDGDDALSHTSFATSINAAIRVPPLPKEARHQEHFECPLCFMIVSIHTKAGWKQHVYRDLHPYCCTFEGCTTADRLYDSRHDWFRHELAHRTTWQCVEECTESFVTESEFEDHIRSRHMELSSPSMLSALKHTAAKSADLTMKTMCPLCNIEMTLRVMQRHMGRHQEQLALFALPSNIDEAEEENEDEEPIDVNKSRDEGSSDTSSHHSDEENESNTFNPPSSGRFVRAMYDYSADDRTSLSFHQGDIIQVLEQLESGWWNGVLKGVQGWFPSNYCVVVTQATIESHGEIEESWDGEPVTIGDYSDVPPEQRPTKQIIESASEDSSKTIEVTDQYKEILHSDPHLKAEEEIDGTEESNIRKHDASWKARTTLDGTPLPFNSLTGRINLSRETPGPDEERHGGHSTPESPVGLSMDVAEQNKLRGSAEIASYPQEYNRSSRNEESQSDDGDKEHGRRHSSDVDASRPSGLLNRRSSRKIVPGLPRPLTFKRMDSEKRDKLVGMPDELEQRRTASADRQSSIMLERIGTQQPNLDDNAQHQAGTVDRQQRATEAEEERMRIIFENTAKLKKRERDARESRLRAVDKYNEEKAERDRKADEDRERIIARYESTRTSESVDVKKQREDLIMQLKIEEERQRSAEKEDPFLELLQNLAEKAEQEAKLKERSRKEILLELRIEEDKRKLDESEEWNRFPKLQKKKEEEEKAEKSKQEADLEEQMRKRLAKFGFDVSQMQTMMKPEEATGLENDDVPKGIEMPTRLVHGSKLEQRAKKRRESSSSAEELVSPGINEERPVGHITESFFDFSQLPSPTPSAVARQQSNAASLATSPASTTVDSEALQTPARPSHKYEPFKHQTGLPIGSSRASVASAQQTIYWRADEREAQNSNEMHEYAAEGEEAPYYFDADDKSMVNKKYGRLG